MTNKIFEDNFFELSEKFIKGRLIDIGCGEKPYQIYLGPLVEEYIGIDHFDTYHDKGKIDVFATAYSIPFDESSFDSAICTAVLEHLEEPEQAIRECYRVLRTGGYAIYSAPFIWHLHEEPRDFFRYSKYGLKYLFEKSGFEVIEIRALSGFAVTFLQLHLYIVKGKFNKGVIKWFGIFRAYNFFCNMFGLFLNKFDNSHEWTWMNIIVVKK